MAPTPFYVGQKLRASTLQDLLDDNLRIAKASSLPRTSATLSADSELALTLKASYTYKLMIGAYFLAAVAGDIQFALSVPAGSTFPFGGLRMVDSSAGLVGDVDPGAYDSATSGSSALTAGGTGLASFALLTATVVVGGTPGAVTLLWALKAASGTTTLYAGSWMTAERFR